MPLWKSLTATAMGLALANCVVEIVAIGSDPQWFRAVDRTFFQCGALFIFWLWNRKRYEPRN